VAAVEAPPSIINRFIIRAVALRNRLEEVAANPSQLQRRRSRIAVSADNTDMK
jgi:hypothetical protein